MARASSGSKRGFTLITALAFTLVVGTVLAGIGTLAMSHYSRAQTDSTYAQAIGLADAGINFEIARISSNTTDPSLPDQMGSPRSGSIPDVPGSFSVYVRPWGTGCNGTGTWAPPADICVESTGTVDGVSRTVRVRGRRKSVFDEFAIYALSNGKFSGGGSGSGTTSIIGDIGTNGSLTFSGTKGTATDSGSVYFNGSSATLASGTNSGNTVGTPDSIHFPTVSDMANSLFPGGLSYLATNNSNASIKILNSTDRSLASEPTIAGLTLSDVNSKLASAGFTAASRTFGDPGAGVPSDTAAIDKYASPSSTWRFVQPATTYVNPGYGIADQSNNKIYFVPPGDYYFTRLNFKQGTSVVVFLTHLGPIRIWIDNGDSQADSLNGVFLFTDPSPNKFRIFYNKCSTLTLSGNSVFPGGFYAVNPACDNFKSTAGTPSLNFTGGSEVLGSVISDYLTLGGSTSIIFPNNAGGDPADFSLWYGFQDNWKEMRYDGTNAPVFPDGTSD